MSQPNAERIDVRLVQIRLEAEDVFSFEFRPIDSPELPAFEAGAHIDLYLPENRVRSYSLLNSKRPGAAGPCGCMARRASATASRFRHP
jgi:vanillate O-demethylase ferredoxin subunit